MASLDAGPDVEVVGVALEVLPDLVVTDEGPLSALGVVEGKVGEGHDLLGQVRPKVLVHAGAQFNWNNLLLKSDCT